MKTWWAFNSFRSTASPKFLNMGNQPPRTQEFINVEISKRILSNVTSIHNQSHLTSWIYRLHSPIRSHEGLHIFWRRNFSMPASYRHLLPFLKSQNKESQMSKRIARHKGPWTKFQHSKTCRKLGYRPYAESKLKTLVHLYIFLVRKQRIPPMKENHLLLQNAF